MLDNSFIYFKDRILAAKMFDSTKIEDCKMKKEKKKFYS
jgi:hypothetical protein